VARARIFFSLENPEGLGVHPALYLVGTGDVSAGVKQQEGVPEHSHPCCAEVKSVVLYLQSPACLHGLHETTALLFVVLPTTTWWPYM
jgi:hypothetical protein